MYANSDTADDKSGEYLELEENNLYAAGYLLIMEGDEQQLLRDPLQWTGSLEDRYHVLTDRDRLDTLAYDYYNDFVADASKYWWVIADANAILNPLDLTDLVGRQLLIPNILNVRLSL